MSLARPNFHSTSDCCWKRKLQVFLLGCTKSGAAKEGCLPGSSGRCPTSSQSKGWSTPPLWPTCRARRQTKKVNDEQLASKEKNQRELRTWNKKARCSGFWGVMFISLSLEWFEHHSDTSRKRGDMTYLLSPKREKKSLIITWTGILQPKQRETWHSVAHHQQLLLGKTRITQPPPFQHPHYPPALSFTPI